MWGKKTKRGKLLSTSYMHLIVSIVIGIYINQSHNALNPYTFIYLFIGSLRYICVHIRI